MTDPDQILLECYRQGDEIAFEELFLRQYARVFRLLYRLTASREEAEDLVLLGSGAAVRVGIVTSLLMPVEALWRRAAYLMQPSLARNIPSPFATASAPSEAMVIYALLYAAVALALAMRVFSRRDL